MQKTTDKFCPNCGHHVYLPSHGEAWYICVECDITLYYEEVATLDDVLHLRESYDTQVEEM